MVLVKDHKKPSLQSCPIESSALLRSNGKIWARCVASDSRGKRGQYIWEAHMMSSLGRRTGSPWIMGTLLVHSVVGTIKRSVHPESTMALLSFVVLLEGTRI